jgi:hypothetical protein
MVVTGGGVRLGAGSVDIVSSDWKASTAPNPDAWVGVVYNTGPQDAYFYVDAICVDATQIVGF